MERRWLSIPQAAEFLQIHKKTAYSWASRGLLPSCRIGGMIRIDKFKLEAGMERQAAFYARMIKGEKK